MIARTGEAAKLPFPVHPHMLRHSTGYKLANDGTTLEPSSTTWAIGISNTRCDTPKWLPIGSRICGGTETQVRQPADQGLCASDGGPHAIAVEVMPGGEASAAWRWSRQSAQGPPRYPRGNPLSVMWRTGRASDCAILALKMNPSISVVCCGA
jgi:hypothetical protein